MESFLQKDIPTGKALRILGAVAVFFVVLIAAGQRPNTPETNSKRQAEPTKLSHEMSTMEACATVQVLMKNRLTAVAKSPDSVIVQCNYNEVSANADDTEFQVRGYFDARNSFNALIRYDYTATARREGKAWSVSNINVSDR